MAKVVFTPNIQRHVLCPEAEAPGRTVREVLENIFSENSQAGAMCWMTNRDCVST